MINTNPTLHKNNSERFKIEWKNNLVKNIDENTIFELLRDILDPEHPYTLEQLNVITQENIKVYRLEKEKEVLCTKGHPINVIEVVFVPTVPHCSLVGIIGLCIAFKLKKYTSGHVLKLKIEKGSHSQEEIYNKQLSDNERILAAFENEAIMDIVKMCFNE